MIFAPWSARAESETTEREPTQETFTGVDISGNAASTYLGAGTAFGKSLWRPGWRARVVGGLGRYDYESGATLYDGRHGFVTGLLGYQMQRGRMTVKLFAGGEYQEQLISPYDPGNSVQGDASGVRLQAETWFDVSPRSFVSVDASYGSAFDEYWGLARYGYRYTPKLTLGLEGGPLGNREYDGGRGGAFVRLEVLKTQLTLSGGVTGDYLESRGSGYVALNVYRNF
ncbi:hypothetical protein A7A08_01914 [Methyloligella halotolerans]|uniref:Cellulose biosynthesis protein BcsS n=1 Tax=Methyloligella halotolerans TaxID=1177755 RepID=A0A1E2RYI7_9HYPH|nr:cellulose biosynthesis protein BcsS [Methyloligella halotolerans]ODA67168.1 hypothetical protein A7A08_01914 [Methyloligella halotolerans]